MKHFAYALLLVLFLNLTGCATAARITERESPDEVLIYGYVMMSSLSGIDKYYLTNFTFKQIDPPSEEPYKYCGRYLGGVIYHVLKPGSYRIDSFKSFTSKSLGPYVLSQSYVNYTVPVKDNGFTVTKPGLYYFGTYDVVNRQNYMNVEYEVNRVNYPSEEDVIVRLLEFTDKGTYWEKMLNNRLSQLRKWRLPDGKKTRVPKVN